MRIILVFVAVLAVLALSYSVVAIASPQISGTRAAADKPSGADSIESYILSLLTPDQLAELQAFQKMDPADAFFYKLQQLKSDEALDEPAIERQPAVSEPPEERPRETPHRDPTGMPSLDPAEIVPLKGSSS